MNGQREVIFQSTNPANVIQCAACGQIVASENPENLKRVCLACCPRIKEDNAGTPYFSFIEYFPAEVLHCKEREQTETTENTETTGA